MTYTKLFSSITESTIWREDDKTRILWITMLAMADKHGRIWASIPGLADRAKISVEATEYALRRFQSSDQYSRTQEHEGRRIEPIDGGWKLLNHKKYRSIRDEEGRRELNAFYQARHRAKNSKDHSLQSAPVSTSEHNAEAAPTPAPTPSISKSEKEVYHPDSRTALHLLNELSGKRFREVDYNLSVITARLRETGVDLDGVRQMIERQVKRWKDTKFAEYLQPSTLFGKQKFDAYYAAKDLPVLDNQERTFKPKTIAEKEADLLLRQLSRQNQ